MEPLCGHECFAHCQHTVLAPVETRMYTGHYPARRQCDVFPGVPAERRRPLYHRKFEQFSETFASSDGFCLTARQTNCARTSLSRRNGTMFRNSSKVYLRPTNVLPSSLNSPSLLYVVPSGRYLTFAGPDGLQSTGSPKSSPTEGSINDAPEDPAPAVGPLAVSSDMREVTVAFVCADRETSMSLYAEYSLDPRVRIKDLS